MGAIDLSRPEYAHLRRRGLSKRDVYRGHNSNGKVEKVMSEYKDGELRSSNGRKVTNRDQALAIALSEQEDS